MDQSTARQHVDGPPRTSTARPSRASSRARRGEVPVLDPTTRRCRRSECSLPATATLVFSYAEQEARIVELLDDEEPQTYDLCDTHADRTSPPSGWQLTDTRPPTRERPRRLEDDDTIAIIAAALQGDDSPRRVDVHDGGPDAAPDAPPRRVTSTSPPAGPAPDVPAEAAGGEDEDPLRAALEELQRVVARDDEVTGATPTPLRRDGLPDAPLDDGPGDDGPDEDHLTLW